MRKPTAAVKIREAITPVAAASTPWPAQTGSTELVNVVGAELGIPVKVVVTMVVEGNVKVIGNAVVNESEAEAGIELLGTPEGTLDDISELAGNPLVNTPVGSKYEVKLRLEIASVGVALKDASENMLIVLSSEVHLGSTKAMRWQKLQRRVRDRLWVV